MKKGNNNMILQDGYWDVLKEDRGNYFVEYYPLKSNSFFASLSLVFLCSIDANTVANIMENELHTWLSRFPIPIMVSAFDDTGSVISLNGIRPINHLIGFIENGNKTIKYWSLVPNEVFPKEQLEYSYVRDVYRELPLRKSEDRNQLNKQRARQIRIGLFIIFVWSVLVPVFIAIIGYASPWVSLLALVYSLWKAVENGFKLFGKFGISEKQRKKQIEEQTIRHHHYHCERNPEGFRKLVAENYESDERERIRKEAESIKKSKG
jgi:hypothetical protein